VQGKRKKEKRDKGEKEKEKRKKEVKRQERNCPRAPQSFNLALFKRYLCLTPACAGLFELTESRLKLLNLRLMQKNFIRRLFWSISSYFVAIHS